MRTDVLIGVDAGSTHLKTAVYDLKGKLIAIQHRRIKACQPSLEFSEYDPEEIFCAMCSCLKDLLIPKYLPVAIGISSFGEGVIPIDEHGEVIDKMIAWYDMRGQKLIEELADEMGHLPLFSITGQSASGKFTLAKFLWYKKNKPLLLQKAHSFLFMQDYLAYRLTECICTEYSLASRSMMYDISQMDWSNELLCICGISRDRLPQIIESGTSAGSITEKAAKTTGLPSGIPVILAGHDHASASIAAGLEKNDVVLDSLGTSETSIFTAAPLEKSKLFKHNLGFYPYYQKQLRYISSIQGCGFSIEWMAKMLFQQDIYAQFFNSVNYVMNNNLDSPIFHPFLRGLQEAPNTFGSFTKLKDIHTRESFCYSILEGLCFEYKRRLKDAEHCRQTSFSSVRVVGRLSKEASFMQLKADILQKPIEILSESEAVSQGAAILAGKYCGCISKWNPEIITVYTPDKSNSDYAKRYETYLWTLGLH